MSRRHTIVLSAIAVAILLLLPLGLLCRSMDLSPNDVWNALLSQDNDNGGDISPLHSGGIAPARRPYRFIGRSGLSIAGCLCRPASIIHLRVVHYGHILGEQSSRCSHSASCHGRPRGTMGTRIAVVSGAFAELPQYFHPSDFLKLGALHRMSC